MKSTYLSRLLAVTALSLGLSAGALAMPPRGDAHGPDMGMPHHHAMMHERAMSRLHDELKLDARQEAAWQEAAKFAQDSRAGAAERFRKHHEEIKSLLDQPGTDLRTVAQRMDALRAEGMKQHDAVRERWLAAYDTLSAEQKEKARVFFKNGMERGEQRMKERARRATPPAPKN